MNPRGVGLKFVVLLFIRHNFSSCLTNSQASRKPKTMISLPGGRLRQPSPYPALWLTIADVISLRLFRVTRFFLDGLMSCLFPTTLENQFYYYLCSFTKIPFYVIGFFVTSPCLAVAFLLYVAICDQREKYRTSTSDVITREPHAKKSYSFVTTNICGHYEYISRVNNLKDSEERVQKIGEIFLTSQIKHINRISQKNGIHRDTNRNIHTLYSQEDKDSNDRMDARVQAEFPDTDFILFQEVVFPEFGVKLAAILHPVYPYAVYDTCDHGLRKNFLYLGGDVMLASRYPILHARFQRYQDQCGWDLFASKGLLQVKVFLGEEGGEKLVGYVSNTHLQVYQGNNRVRARQLDAIVRWTAEYRKLMSRPEERVVFDVLGGDLNMSNVSPVDQEDWDHPIFDVYKDVCRKQPGKDQDFAIGTEMRQSTLYDDDAATPVGLQAALQDPGRRRWHILDGDLSTIGVRTCFELPPREGTTGKVISYPSGGKRRVDYLLTRREDQSKTTAYNPVTALAGLTDHIPVSMTLDIR